MVNLCLFPSYFAKDDEIARSICWKIIWNRKNWVVLFCSFIFFFSMVKNSLGMVIDFPSDLSTSLYQKRVSIYRFNDLEWLKVLIQEKKNGSDRSMGDDDGDDDDGNDNDWCIELELQLKLQLQECQIVAHQICGGSVSKTSDLHNIISSRALPFTASFVRSFSSHRIVITSSN